jgi:signal transduction histidine kinase
VLLRTKFTLLIGMLSLTVAASLGAAVWSVALLQQELAEPFESVASSLGSLGRLRDNVDATAEMLTRGRDDESLRLEYQTVGSAMVARAEGLRREETLARRIGSVSAQTLAQRADRALALGRAWWSTGDPSQRDGAAEQLRTMRQIIGLLEARILDDASQVVAYGERIRLRMLLIIAITFASALLMALLGLVLFRRWVIAPVARLRDATERISQGDFAHRIAVEGRDELAQLSGQVNHMAATVLQMQDERVERERLAAVGEMLRRLSHNIRNPLAGIRGVAEIAERRLEGDSPLREHMGRIIKTVDRLDIWLRDLLRSSSPLELRPEPVEVGPWLTGLLEAHRPIASTKDVVLEVCVEEAPREAVFDRRHLEQAVTALVTNAIQASSAGGRVRVSARLGAAGVGWTVEVSDEGPGVDAEQAEAIFRPHFTTKPDGTGMGLAVAQQVVQGHGGSIHVDRGVGDGRNGDPGAPGAVFRVELPLRPVRPAGPPDQDGAAVDENSRH